MAWRNSEPLGDYSNIQNDEKSQSVISQIENCIVSQESVIATSMLCARNKLLNFCVKRMKV